MIAKAGAREGNVFHGIPASSGIVIGKAYVLDRHMICVLEHPIPDGEVDEEIERFRAAAEKAENDLRELSERAAAEFGDDIPFMIFDAYVQILKDPSMRREVENIIREKRRNAEWALKLLQEKYQTRFSKIKDKYFRERLNDIEQVVTRLQRHLVQDEDVSLENLTEPVIIVSHDLSPADTIQMDPSKVMGFAIDVGGKTSHAGIIASSMDIPAVVGLKTLSLHVRSGDSLIIDGNTGEVAHMPTPEQFQKYNQRRQRYLYFDKELHAQKDLEARTLDGVTIKLLANIESSHDLTHVLEHGASGVGLYRTEYLYINKLRWPDEQEQFDDYRKVAETLAPNPAVIRTLDIGGDKLAVGDDYLENEPNPALGLRAIRFCLANPEIFKTQLRAILRASAYGNLKIMYPLITSPDEVIAANDILQEAKDELKAEGKAFNENIPVGIMVETPSAVMIAGELAKLSSFFSIGTNDLIQYTMAIDRVNERVAYLYQPLSPAIIRMLNSVVKAAEEAGIPVSVCGKMAGDPTYAMLLIGMGGVRELSMDVHSIPRIKKFIRSINIEDARRIAEEALRLDSTERMKNYMVEHIQKFFVEGVSSDLVENDG
ncbi:MAG: phosphoenolpyruvate--protein phosphotransferase [Candidatus Nitrospinota bacterium M3_3B_026]